MGATALSIAPWRRCTCESKGFLMVMEFATRLVYTPLHGEKECPVASIVAAQKVGRENPCGSRNTDTEQSGSLSCVYAWSCNSLQCDSKKSETCAHVHDQRAHGRGHLRRLGGVGPWPHRRARSTSGDGREVCAF